MSKTIYNFSAGPAVIPKAVLQQARDDLLDWNNTGGSVMEMSHRESNFTGIASKAEADLRKLMNIPDNYKVLFLQGGASGQFAAIPLNLAKQNDSADYVVTGAWSKKAFKEGKKYVDGIHAAAETTEYTHVPKISDWKHTKKPAYVHITPNETIHGVAFNELPDTGDVPLVADMSSTILSQPVDVSKYGVIYAGAQKNIGPAGLTIVIVRDDLLGNARPETPAVWDWTQKAAASSMVNTPPTYAWYTAGLVFDWLLQNGGLEAIAEVNERKAAKLYEAIDSSSLYANPVHVDNRSLMNVPFTLSNPELDPLFLSQATDAGLTNLKGHRSIGGIRASIYNAMPEEGVDALIAFMQEFENAQNL